MAKEWVKDRVKADRNAQPMLSLMAENANVNEEQALVLKAGEGDLEAFSRLVELYQERAIRIAGSFLRNGEDARDAAQEAFVKAWRAIGSFKGHSRFSTWFYRILVNQCKDELRRRSARGIFLFWKQESEEEDDRPDEPVCAEPGPSELALDRELAGKIQSAIEELPFRQKAAFTLRYLEGLEIAEIAESLDLTAGAVKAHLWQACQKMRNKLEHYRSMEGQS